MIKVIKVLIPSTLIFLGWGFAYYATILQKYLFNNHHPLWEEINNEPLFRSPNRKSSLVLPMNSNLFRIIFAKNKVNDRKLDAILFKLRIIIYISIFIALISFAIIAFF